MTTMHDIQGGEPADTATSPSAPRLGYWSLYFVLKLVLYGMGVLQLRPLENLALIVFLAYPLKSRWLSGLRNLAGVVGAVWLIHAESWLPDWPVLWSSLMLMLDFELEYLLELAARLFTPELVAALLFTVLGYLIVDHYLRMGALVTLAMVYLALAGPERKVPVPAVAGPSPETAVARGSVAAPGLDGELERFYREQATKEVHFSAPLPEHPPFDILFLHICSLSWDDLRHVGAEGLLPAFDVLFQRFNTATSYSGPAAIRLLRAGCGQSRHQSLYEPLPQACSLFDQLESMGYRKQLAMNHDGHFDDFLQLLSRNGMDAPPQPLGDVPVALRAFDGSPIHDDLAVLSAWWSKRQAREETRMALYYNTLTLHDGNRFVDNRKSRNSLDGYGQRLRALMNDLQAFFRQLEQSERRVLVVMVPEHGAALKGSTLQLQGMREIPTPDITLVPAGIRLFGPGLTAPRQPVVVPQTVSYLALAEYVAGLLSRNPFLDGEYRPQHLAANLSEVRLVSETSTAVVMEAEQRHWLRMRDGDEWLPLEL